MRALCDEAGIRLDALGGEPDWALDRARAVAWRDTVLALGVFRGLHVDVEPYLLPDWSTRRDLAVAALLPATAANADTPDLGLVVPPLSPMLPGQSGWVGTMWAAADDICGLKVTASGANVTVTYPGNTATYASLSKADTLRAGSMDYTAFKLSVPTTHPIALIPMTLTATYTEVADGATTCVGTKKTVTANATLPVIAPIGDAVVA